MVVSLYVGVEKAMFQRGKMYLVRSPAEQEVIPISFNFGLPLDVWGGGQSATRCARST